MNIGFKIKELRIKNGLTLEELAARSELTKGFLSQLERDLTSPSIATLDDILEALGSNLSEFFSDDTNNKLNFKKEDYYINEKDGATTIFIVPNAQKNDMEPIIIDLDINAQSEVIKPHEGQEFGYVLSGVVTLVCGKDTYQIKKGETFYLTGKHEHYLINNSLKTVKVLWVSNPPIF